MASSDRAVQSSTSSFFSTIFNKAHNEESSLLTPFSLNGNPQDIAVKPISVEHDYWYSLSLMEQKKTSLISQLESSADSEKEKLRDDLKNLDVEIDAFKSTKQVFLRLLKIGICSTAE